ncbi:Nuclear distribution protein nudE-like 1-A [Gossypium australe]|uniref:Methyltransferase n=1 Tax=Gossypium australe TaxID=47621 RepID=A0A5B6W3M9_9ROSI|nr:Nuclear distribution protein nudE-like 1-A [Gossypium australe]
MVHFAPTVRISSGPETYEISLGIPSEVAGEVAALVDDPLWVMSVVSSYAPNTLLVVYDRDLIGNYHDW